MKRDVTECDICSAAYDPSREADEPFHEVGLADPPPMSPQDEARLDRELKAATAQLNKQDTLPEAKQYYTERKAALIREAEKRRAVAAEERVDVGLICHTCYLLLREHVRQMRQMQRV